MPEPMLTTTAACNVAGINRDRFNEHVAAEHYTCAPRTIPGRSRLFKPKDMIGLCLFHQLLGDGLQARVAGEIACAVMRAARQNPKAEAVSYVFSWFGDGDGYACPTDEVPSVAEFGTMTNDDSTVRQVLTFNIAGLRARIAYKTEIERSIIGPAD